MRFLLNYSIALVIVSSLISCGGGHDYNEAHEGHDHEHEGHNHASETEADGCVLVYNADSTKLSWTAYKTNDKIGVLGAFDSFSLGGFKEGATAAEVFENGKFNIASASVNSKNPDRDKKISEHFFSTMLNGLSITGTVSEVSNNHAVVLIDMNGVTMKQMFDLKTDDATYCTIQADLNLENWNAIESVNALNKVCYDLHKGADGVSKLWSEVHVELTVQLDKECP
jgi:hypothetical protein